ncbi:hypothetical protein K402DRAFT_402339 [Aulographum hederae CBS 113979]|uniref:Uncharacterized protein n=1 Tax=Aulographum hederae CBS 113979 TaxID=1176131 RepID=A0A6G1H7F2_9PEZI|nr:hypothetical protein K402DRAFT_402339 [Aulographum hederae CBS 113979]
MKFSNFAGGIAAALRYSQPSSLSPSVTPYLLISHSISTVLAFPFNVLQPQTRLLSSKSASQADNGNVHCPGGPDEKPMGYLHRNMQLVDVYWDEYCKAYVTEERGEEKERNRWKKVGWEDEGMEAGKREGQTPLEG